MKVELEFTVFGLAQPAGSKRAFVVKGRDGRVSARVVDDNAKSKPWKAEVRAVAVEAMGRRPLIEGPIHLEVVFLRPRPRGHFNARGDLNAAGRRMTYPTTKPDRTKLLRGLEDALTGLVWRDDAQVVAGNAWKDWGEPARTEVWISTI